MENLNRRQPNSGGITEPDITIEETASGTDYGKYDWDQGKYIQPESWQNQDFPVRSDFLPRLNKKRIIEQTGEPRIIDEWDWYRW